MPITHTNRKGLTYYLCKTVTQSSKPSYVVTRELKGQSVEHLPGDYIHDPRGQRCGSERPQDPRSSSDCKHLVEKPKRDRGSLESSANLSQSSQWNLVTEVESD